MDYKLTLLLLLEPQEVMFQVKSLALDESLVGSIYPRGSVPL